MHGFTVGLSNRGQLVASRVGPTDARRRHPRCRSMDVESGAKERQALARAPVAFRGLESGTGQWGALTSAPSSGVAASASSYSLSPCVGGTRRNAPASCTDRRHPPCGFCVPRATSRCEASLQGHSAASPSERPMRGDEPPHRWSLSPCPDWYARSRRTLRRCSLHRRSHCKASARRKAERCFAPHP